MRLVDHAKRHLVVVPVRDVGPLIARGAIHVDGHAAAIDTLVTSASTITIEPEALANVALAPEPIDLEVAYEDESVLAVVKPAGMHVHPLGPHRTGTLLNALLWHCGARADSPWAAWRPAPVHRLDRAASGLVVFGKTAAVCDALRRTAMHRAYVVVVDGCVAGDSGTIAAPLGRDPTLDYRRAVVVGGQHAVTHWRVIERRASQTVLGVTLETGRTHQIRAHLASIGHPVAGDDLYASGVVPGASSIALHASSVVFRHPVTGVMTSVSDVTRP